MFAPARNLFRNTRAASRSLQKQKRTAGTARMRPEKLRIHQLMFGAGRVPTYQPKTTRRVSSLATEHIRVYDQTYVVRLPTHLAALDGLRQWYPNLYKLLLLENARYTDYEQMWAHTGPQESADYDDWEDYQEDYQDDYEDMWDRLDYQEWMCD